MARIDGETGSEADTLLERAVYSRYAALGNLMKNVVVLLEELKKAGIMEEYALFGAVAQMRYTEPVATLDADVLVLLPAITGLDLLGPVYRFCEQKGFRPQGEAIQVGTWPVQIIPAFDDLTTEAVRKAAVADLDGVPARVVRADYLAVIALSVGRAKDFTRILALLESGATSATDIERLAARHKLRDRWIAFQKKFLNE
jgi:hypothetical protein